MRGSLPVRGGLLLLLIGVFLSGAAASILTSTAADLTFATLALRLEGERWSGYCQDLSGARPVSTPSGPFTFTTRHSFSPQNKVAALYLEQALERVGVPAEVIPFEEHAHTVVNVCGTLPGDTASRVVVGAHFDSRGEDLDSFESAAPGAVDNASGVATVLELARVMAGTRRGASVEFCFYSGEEQNLYGSRYHARVLKKAGAEVRGVLVLDMVGQFQQYPGIIAEGRLREVSFLWGLTSAMERVQGLEVVPHYYSYDSDHVSYQRQGFPAVLLIERNWERYRHYHEATDTAAHVDVKTGMLLARAALSALVDLAEVSLVSEEVPLLSTPAALQ